MSKVAHYRILLELDPLNKPPAAQQKTVMNNGMKEVMLPGGLTYTPFIGEWMNEIVADGNDATLIARANLLLDEYESDRNGDASKYNVETDIIPTVPGLDLYGYRIENGQLMCVHGTQITGRQSGEPADQDLWVVVPGSAVPGPTWRLITWLEIWHQI